MYSKPPFAGPEQVLAYLARYTYRIALSNDRLVALQDGQVTFRWKDRAHGNAPRLATLDAPTFLRRFLLHVLPHRFVRIRHYGLLANPVRTQTLLLVRQWLPPAAPAGAATPSPAPRQPERWDALLLRLTGKDVTQCPRCGVGHLLVVETLPAVAGPGGPVSSRPQPMTPLVSRSAPVASPDTPALCLYSLASTSRLAPARFIAPSQAPGLTHAAHCSPTSPCPGAFSPPISIDHSP